MLDETHALPAGRLRCQLFGPAAVAELQRDLEQWLASHALVRIVKAETHYRGGRDAAPEAMAAALWYLAEEPRSKLAATAAAEVIEAAEEVLAAATEEPANGARRADHQAAPER